MRQAAVSPPHLASGTNAPPQGGRPHVPVQNPLLLAKGEAPTVPRPGLPASRHKVPMERADGRRLAVQGAVSGAGAAQPELDPPGSVAGNPAGGRGPAAVNEGGGSAADRSGTQPGTPSEQQSGAGQGEPDMPVPEHDGQAEIVATINKEHDEQWLRMKRMCRGRKLYLQKEIRAAVERKDQALVAFLCEMQRNMDDDYAKVEYDLTLYTTMRLHVFD
jgi:hypothetical protein